MDDLTAILELEELHALGLIEMEELEVGLLVRVKRRHMPRDLWPVRTLVTPRQWNKSYGYGKLLADVKELL